MRRNALMRVQIQPGEEEGNPPSLLAQLRVRQTEDWRGGNPRQAEEYLAEAGGLGADDRLVLVIGELLLRWERGERPELADYQARYPEHAADLADQFELTAGLATNTAGETLT